MTRSLHNRNTYILYKTPWHAFHKTIAPEWSYWTKASILILMLSRTCMQDRKLKFWKTTLCNDMRVINIKFAINFVLCHNDHETNQNFTTRFKILDWKWHRLCNGRQVAHFRSIAVDNGIIAVIMSTKSRGQGGPARRKIIRPNSGTT